ncbi:MAG: tetratricopeptide repeat protein [Leptolyngbyaceae cyanobacterium CRU_2_3]|nr:tetratricopeptide repeat protein [Leptolyngbyaceae cyanobacterium CRU_2_3]
MPCCNSDENKEAIANFNRALKVKPDYASAHYNKASCYALQGQTDLALESLQKAIDLNSKYRKEAKADANFSELSRDDWFQEITGQ